MQPDPGGGGVADSVTTGQLITTLRSPQRGEWLSAYVFDSIRTAQRAMVDWNGVYSGRQGQHHYVYLKYRTDEQSAVRFAVQLDTLLLIYHQELGSDGYLLDAGNEPTAALVARYETALSRLITVARSLLALVPKQYRAYAMAEDGRLTVAQRVYGLTQFWTEVKYNFAYFDQVPEVDWDAKLLEYLPLVTAPQSNTAYYRLLQRLCAELRDGHTNVYPPAAYYASLGTPGVRLVSVAGQYLVEDVDSTLVRQLPPGSEVVTVDGQPLAQYLADSIYPYISAGSQHVLELTAAQELLLGTLGTSVAVGVRQRPGGEVTELRLGRQSFHHPIHWTKPPPAATPASFVLAAAGVGVLTINTFADGSIVDTFQRYRAQIGQCEGLIIDLRQNGGGDSGNGYAILPYFSPQPLLTSAWRTRESRAAYRAWGQYFGALPNPPEGEFYEEAIRTYREDNWYYGAPDTLPPADTVYDLPVAVLVSHRTASAAEDFLVAADAIPHWTFVGEASYGSTGQPLTLNLPGGGAARVCTKRDTYADGRAFVGPGVQVDVAVEPTVEQYLRGEDVVLERALELVRSRR